MSVKLRDYQVIDVFCGGTFYKVRHKVTNNIFAWKAYNCSAHTDEQLQNVVNEVKIISKLSSDILVRYHDTILHAPTRTLYFVLEYVSGRSLAELAAEGRRAGRRFAEGWLWRLLHGLARAASALGGLRLSLLRPGFSADAVFVSEHAELRVNCFEWASAAPAPAGDLMRQAGALLRSLCSPPPPPLGAPEAEEFHYSDDLQDVLAFLAASRALRPDALLYHPTVLTNLETLPEPKCISEILISIDHSVLASQVNKCDSEKAVELCKAIQPLPRTIFNVGESPLYGNWSPKRKHSESINLSQDALSPTLAALALELPGFVPRGRRAAGGARGAGGARAHRVAEEAFSQEWLARLAALRRREDSLNQRERDLIAKEILNSPGAKVIPFNDSQDLLEDSNGITLPPVLSQVAGERPGAAARRRRRRSGSARRRKSYGYEELDSSLSADNGDGSLVITAAKFTADNMPRRNIFPEFSTKKVHFTAANPFVESDDSVTLTFYDLDSVDKDGYQVPKQKLQQDISKFKYIDLEKITSEKRAAMSWSHSSPSKQAKISKSVLCDISNQSSIRKTPSKSSLCSNGSRWSARSHWSQESGVSERTRARQSLAPCAPAPPPTDVKKKSRMSLIPFKTPFKFMSSKS